MNFFALSVIMSVAGSVAFFFFGRSGAMVANASMLLSFQTIIVAAVLVRLNRGVPSLDWKSVDLQPIRNLLDRLEEVSKVYIVVVFATLLSIILLLGVIYVEKADVIGKGYWIDCLSSTFGMLLGLLISRMAYVVWLDLDIVRLQRAVILSAAETDAQKKQALLANDKIKTAMEARISQL